MGITIIICVSAIIIIAIFCYTDYCNVKYNNAKNIYEDFINRVDNNMLDVHYSINLIEKHINNIYDIIKDKKE